MIIDDLIEEIDRKTKDLEDKMRSITYVIAKDDTYKDDKYCFVTIRHAKLLGLSILDNVFVIHDSISTSVVGGDLMYNIPFRTMEERRGITLRMMGLDRVKYYSDFLPALENRRTIYQSSSYEHGFTFYPNEQRQDITQFQFFPKTAFKSIAEEYKKLRFKK